MRASPTAPSVFKSALLTVCRCLFRLTSHEFRRVAAVCRRAGTRARRARRRRRPQPFLTERTSLLDLRTEPMRQRRRRNCAPPVCIQCGGRFSVDMATATCLVLPHAGWGCRSEAAPADANARERATKMQESSEPPGFSFSLAARNAHLARVGAAAPRVKKTGTTIAGVRFKVGQAPFVMIYVRDRVSRSRTS